MKKAISGLFITALFFSQNLVANDSTKVDEAYKALTYGLIQNKDADSDKMAETLSQQLYLSLKVINDPKIIKANAKYIKNLYDALIEEGFTEEQALKLVSASPLNTK